MSNVSYLHGRGCHYGATIHGIRRIAKRQSTRIMSVHAGLETLAQKSLSCKTRERIKQAQLYLSLAQQEMDKALEVEQERVLGRTR